MVSCFRIRLAVCQALESSRLKPLLPDSGIWRPGFPGAARDRGQSTVGGSPPTMTTSAGRRANRPTLTRSEEHTSELQSLMRISYAVFCLKKKKKDNETSNQ